MYLSKYSPYFKLIVIVYTPETKPDRGEARLEEAGKTVPRKLG